MYTKLWEMGEELSEKIGKEDDDILEIGNTIVIVRYDKWIDWLFRCELSRTDVDDA